MELPTPKIINTPNYMELDDDPTFVQFEPFVERPPVNTFPFNVQVGVPEIVSLRLEHGVCSAVGSFRNGTCVTTTLSGEPSVTYPQTWARLVGHTEHGHLVCLMVPYRPSCYVLPPRGVHLTPGDIAATTGGGLRQHDVSVRMYRKRRMCGFQLEQESWYLVEVPSRHLLAKVGAAFKSLPGYLVVYDTEGACGIREWQKAMCNHSDEYRPHAWLSVTGGDIIPLEHQYHHVDVEVWGAVCVSSGDPATHAPRRGISWDLETRGCAPMMDRLYEECAPFSCSAVVYEYNADPERCVHVASFFITTVDPGTRCIPGVIIVRVWHPVQLFQALRRLIHRFRVRVTAAHNGSGFDTVIQRQWCSTWRPDGYPAAWYPDVPDSWDLVRLAELRACFGDTNDDTSGGGGALLEDLSACTTLAAAQAVIRKSGASARELRAAQSEVSARDVVPEGIEWMVWKSLDAAAAAAAATAANTGNGGVGVKQYGEPWVRDLVDPSGVASIATWNLRILSRVLGVPIDGPSGVRRLWQDTTYTASLSRKHRYYLAIAASRVGVTCEDVVQDAEHLGVTACGPPLRFKVAAFKTGNRYLDPHGVALDTYYASRNKNPGGEHSLRMVAMKYGLPPKVDLHHDVMFQIVQAAGRAEWGGGVSPSPPPPPPAAGNDGDDTPTFTTVCVYNVFDSLIVAQLLIKWKFLSEVTSWGWLCSRPLQDRFDGGTMQPAATLLFMLACPPEDGTFVFTNEKIPFEGDLQGAFCLDAQPGYYRGHCTSIDVNSLYPTVQQLYNMCFTTVIWTEEGATAATAAGYDIEEFLINGRRYWFVQADVRRPELLSNTTVVPKMQHMLTAARGVAKKKQAAAAAAGNLREAENEEMKQQAIKLMSNSSYGAFGNEHFPFSALVIAAATTAAGRRVITGMKHTLGNVFSEKFVCDTPLTPEFVRRMAEVSAATGSPLVWDDSCIGRTLREAVCTMAGVPETFWVVPPGRPALNSVLLGDTDSVMVELGVQKGSPDTLVTLCDGKVLPGPPPPDALEAAATRNATRGKLVFTPGVPVVVTESALTRRVSLLFSYTAADFMVGFVFNVRRHQAGRWVMIIGVDDVRENFLVVCKKNYAAVKYVRLTEVEDVHGKPFIKGLCAVKGDTPRRVATLFRTFVELVQKDRLAEGLREIGVVVGQLRDKGTPVPPHEWQHVITCARPSQVKNPDGNTSIQARLHLMAHNAGTGLGVPDYGTKMPLVCVVQPKGTKVCHTMVHPDLVARLGLDMNRSHYVGVIQGKFKSMSEIPGMEDLQWLLRYLCTHSAGEGGTMCGGACRDCVRYKSIMEREPCIVTSPSRWVGPKKPAVYGLCGSRTGPPASRNIQDFVVVGTPVSWASVAVQPPPPAPPTLPSRSDNKRKQPPCGSIERFVQRLPRVTPGAAQLDLCVPLVPAAGTGTQDDSC